MTFKGSLVSFLLLLAATALLGGCDSNSRGGFTTEPVPPPPPPPTSNLRIGRGQGAGFVEGEVDAPAALAAGGSATLSVTVVDVTGQPFTADPVNYVFDSNCVAQGIATVSPVTVTNSTGLASSTYTDIACSSTDLILVTALVNGTTLSATASIAITAVTVASTD